jgi:hypothetical protein
MLEIFLIIAVSKKISAMMTQKGRNPTGYVILFIALWFGGEIVGGILGAIVTILMDRRAMEGDGLMCGAYVLALIGAAIGGTIGYVIASSASDLSPPRVPDFDDDDDDYGEEGRARRRRRRSAAIEEEDREPRRKRPPSKHDEGIEEDR